jgi:hypothetical protein
MDGRTDGQSYEWMDKLNGWTDEYMNYGMYVQINGRTDGRINFFVAPSASEQRRGSGR